MNDYVIYHANNLGTAADGFTKVAVVSAHSLGEAFRLSNNIEESWVDNCDVFSVNDELLFSVNGLRSTSSGDVIFDSNEGKFYFLVPMGYENDGDTIPVDDFNIKGFLDFYSNGVLFKEDGFYEERLKKEVL
tara:strand:- start:3545 stop:3940 length:396 start_codon:yes stop_codon:yes gene_type:complete